MALIIYYPTFHHAYLLNVVRKGLETILTDGKGISRTLFRTEKNGLPLELVHNFGKDFSENCLCI